MTPNLQESDPLIPPRGTVEEEHAGPYQSNRNLTISDFDVVEENVALRELGENINSKQNNCNTMHNPLHKHGTQKALKKHHSIQNRLFLFQNNFSNFALFEANQPLRLPLRDPFVARCRGGFPQADQVTPTDYGTTLQQINP